MDHSEEYRKLISDMEYIIVKHCSTKNLMNGQNYRYPVHYVSNEKRYVSKGNGKVDIPADAVSSMKYKFGGHTLEIGPALEEILDYLSNNRDMLPDGPSLFDLL